ncbi:hypothetical protein A4G19_14855 [Pasteurellaceae bacterium Macca]|nr:hypothetical protein [Pasteurellaceae bacterium Macca]
MINQSDYPLISVIMPIYNREKYLNEAIQAVINQTYQNLEIILINDGSSDNSAQIMECWAKKDPRIITIHNEHNLGLIKTLNKAIQFAKGEFIARTDSDDIVFPHWISSILKKMLSDPKILVCGAQMITMGNEGILSKNFRDGYKFEFPSEHQDIVLSFQFRNVISHSCVLIHKSVFTLHQLRYDENYPHAEDFKLWLEVVKIGGKLANVQDYLLYYRLHENQVSSLFNQPQQNVGKKVRVEVINMLLKNSGIEYELNYPITQEDILQVWLNTMQIKMSTEIQKAIIKVLHYNL